MSARIKASNVRTKRVYEHPERFDGTRILIDRLWPRGVSKAKAAIDQWCKELAPSTELRQWFDHDPARWTEFRRRYALELREHADVLTQLRAIARRGPLTLVYSAHDMQHNNAVALRALVLGR